MNLPNQLTMFRIILIPVFILLYVLKDLIGPTVFYWIGIVFIIASLTDFFDGKIARKRNLVTTFGKFIDPLADKLLVMAALLVLSDNFKDNPTMWMPFWVVVIILSREFIVTSIRLVAVGEGKVIAASSLGKYKTATTMVMIIYYFFLMNLNIPVIHVIGIILTGISVALTLISGTDYLLKNKHLIFESI